ncbi:hypothetical protein AB6A40_002422 [Gnathostoma spinigerum]|uniref:Oxysterol-binding protein n=1 Tax=Gnathostoma spinigerum TaxID=75299 RepID=A0ABD6E6I7_9BILA
MAAHDSILDSGKAANTTDEAEDSEASRKATLKKQKREYKDEKRRVAQELLAALRDPTVVVMADWLKVRGTLRKWNRYFCVLKPGLMMIYKSSKTEKPGHWVGTILLNTCELIERPSRKAGFCFKLFHPLDQNIWATRGPLGETHGAVTLQPLPTTYLICRAQSEQAGGCWMDALQLALRFSGLLMRTMHKVTDDKKEDEINTKETELIDADSVVVIPQPPPISEMEAEKHFLGIDDDGDNTVASDSEGCGGYIDEDIYVQSGPEQLGPLDDSVQAEDVGEENRSLVWSILKQVRPGMDLSKVTLPTFILEPRSFLEKLADFYYHMDILSEVVVQEDPLARMITVVKFYLSGFYKKPKGLKKPYNPILGETFRCKWQLPDDSQSFYIAEQVSHHPPISALFLTNRKAGFNIAGTILARSKYYGNSLSAMMIGTVDITLLTRGEVYSVTLPYANCKGIMIGTLTMEYGGQVTIKCDKTGYECVLEFKLKPFLGGSMNVISGKIKLGNETLVQIEGHWDSEITISEDGSESLLWSPTKEIVQKRLQRYEIPLEKQNEWESKKLWLKVSEAIMKEDQIAATSEKSLLENAQRKRLKLNPHPKPKYFKYDATTRSYSYIYADYRPWDLNNDVKQVENSYVIRTILKHGSVARPSSNLSHDSGQKDFSDASDSTIAGRHRKRGKKRTRSPEEDQLRQIQDCVERTARAVQRISDKLEQSECFVAKNHLLIILGLFAILQATLVPFIMRWY